MKYMLLLYEPDTDWQSVPKEVLDKAMAEHEAFARYLDERGIPHSGGALGMASASTTLRPDGDGMVVTDGPFIELKEHIGGFYVIDVKDLDEAIEVAGRCPTTTATEVRPIWG